MLKTIELECVCPCPLFKVQLQLHVRNIADAVTQSPLTERMLLMDMFATAGIRVTFSVSNHSTLEVEEVLRCDMRIKSEVHGCQNTALSYK